MDTTLRKRRHNRIRSRLRGTAVRPRAHVIKSLTRMHVQLIDDDARKTMAAASGKPEEVGQLIAEAAKKIGIETIVFDRGGYKYHGRIKTVAQTMRNAGLKF